MVIFRENTEDIYAGIEFAGGTEDAQKVIAFFEKESKRQEVRFPATSAIGVKPVSREGTSGWCARPSSTPSINKRRNVTLVHKGNIMKYTEGAFRDWGYALGAQEFGASASTAGPGCSAQEPERADIVIKDAIADAFLQQVLTRPEEYDVIATLNLNGDYISMRWRRRWAASASRPAAT